MFTKRKFEEKIRFCEWVLGFGYIGAKATSLGMVS